MSEGAIDGESGAYVPCLEAASPFPDDPVGAITGSDVGFVPKDMEASPFPDDPSGAIVGTSVGYVENIPSSVASVTNITEIAAHDGVETARSNRLSGFGNPPPSLGLGQWQTIQDIPPGSGAFPVHDYEWRTFFRYDVNIFYADAEFYRLRASLIEASPTTPIEWELWAGDPAWDLDGDQNYVGGYLIAADIIPARNTVAPEDLTFGVVSRDIDVTWAADHPRYAWFYFINVSPTGYVSFDPSIVLNRGDSVDIFDYGDPEHFNEGGQTAFFASPYPFEVTAISACE